MFGMDKCREAFERFECEKYEANYDAMKKNWDWCESQFGYRYSPDSLRGKDWAIWQEAWQHQQAKVEELQKRLYGALKETQYALQYVEGDMRGNHEFLQMAMIRTFKTLEQALNGEVIGHEVHFKKIKKERDELQTLYTQQGINMFKLQKRVDKAIRFLVEAELYQSEPNIDLAVKALNGDQYDEHRKKSRRGNLKRCKPNQP